MKILDGLSSRCKKKEEPEDLMKIARIVGPLVDETVKEIFAS